MKSEEKKRSARFFLECHFRADIDSSDESDAEEDIDQPTLHKTKHDLMMKGEGSRKGSFFKQAKKSYPMFPAPEERIKWDEYGEIIKYVVVMYTNIIAMKYSKTRKNKIHCFVSFTTLLCALQTAKSYRKLMIRIEAAEC